MLSACEMGSHSEMPLSLRPEGAWKVAGCQELSQTGGFLQGG